MEVPGERPDAEATGPVCPECGSSNTWTKGAKGATGRALLGGGVLDAAGLVSHDLRLRYKCRDCRHSFVAEEGEWDAGQLVEPCTIVLHREKGFKGALIPLVVHLNGTQVGTVANGASIEFQTFVRSNTIVVADHNGATRKGMAQMFEAEDGGTAAFRLRKVQLSRV